MTAIADKRTAFHIRIEKSRYSECWHFRGFLIGLKPGTTIETESITFDRSREGLVFDTRIDNHLNYSDPAPEPWGLEWGYEHHTTLELVDLAAKHRFASGIQRNLDKLAEQDGDTRSLGQWVMRLCKAAGAEGVLRKSPRDDDSWQLLTAPKDIVYVIDGMFQEWRNKRLEAVKALHG